MAETERIPFNKPRSFTETINVAFKFLREHYKSFLKAVIYITGPFVLLSGITSGLYYADTFSSTLKQEFPIAGTWFLNYGLLIIGSFLSSIMMLGTVIEYMRLYNENEGKEPSFDDIWNAVKKRFWKLVGTAMGIGLAFFIGIIIFSILVRVSGALSPVLSVLWVVLFLIGMLLVMPPMIHYVYSVFIIRSTEGMKLYPAMQRAMDLLKPNFWKTWLMVFITLLMFNTISGIGFVPMMVAIFISAMHGINDITTGDYSLITITTAFATVFSSLLYCVPLVIWGFHHYSLVEKSDGKGMMDMIGKIGNTEENDPDKPQGSPGHKPV